MAGLSKSRILQHRQCPRRLWLQINRPELAEEASSTTTRMAAGNQVGELARKLYPDGVLIEGDSLAQALDDTIRILAAERRPVFEATFNAGGVLIRADLLLPDNGGYRMVEVKSSTSVKDYHLDDAAVQAWVAKQVGLSLTGVDIAHIDTSFVYPGNGDYQGLFAFADITKEAARLGMEVPDWIRSAQNTLAGDDPGTVPGEQCGTPFDCPFRAYCSPPENEDGYPPELLPYGKTIAAELRAEGYADLRQVPEDRLSNPRHRRVWRATIAGKPELDPAAGAALRGLPYPRYYLDFETIQFAIPIWAGTRPYQQMPFQWSCHVETADGILTHLDFLAQGSGDPRRAFADTLLAAIGTEGPILVYNASFERSRMTELAEAYPDLAPALNEAVTRIVDLLPIAREHYYHPAMRGSWSIKAVLPTIAPQLDYGDLEVGNGGMAMEVFAEILDPVTVAEKRSRLRAALLEYCQRDTLAMVEVSRFFERAN
jgi:hypothetical protein